ncbi:MAG: D-2-hydroxyacid dehydrogenase [Anaerolineales bacterium]
MKTILLGLPADERDETRLARVRELAPDYRLVVSVDDAEIEAILDDIEIAAARVPRALIAQGKNLRWMQQWGAGADWLLDDPVAVERDFVLTNASGIHAIPISEHILAMMLALARRLPEVIRRQPEHRWQRPDTSSVRELAGSTAVVIGLGAIGGRTARLLHAHEVHVIGVRRNPSVPAEGVERIAGPNQLLSVLPEADWVVITAPLTAETRHLIGQRELAAMKPTAYILNIGRGAIIDQDALIDALRSGRLAGAGLDVTTPEPLPADSPLWDLPNVILSPHYSGSTPHYEERAFALFLENLRRYLAGEPLLNVVDKRLAYGPRYSQPEA